MTDIVGSHWVKYSWFEVDIYEDEEYQLSDSDELTGKEWELTDDEKESIEDEFAQGQSEGTFYREDEALELCICIWEIDRGSHF